MSGTWRPANLLISFIQPGQTLHKWYFLRWERSVWDLFGNFIAFGARLLQRFVNIQQLAIKCIMPMVWRFSIWANYVWIGEDDGDRVFLWRWWADYLRWVDHLSLFRQLIICLNLHATRGFLHDFGFLGRWWLDIINFRGHICLSHFLRAETDSLRANLKDPSLHPLLCLDVILCLVGARSWVLVDVQVSGDFAGKLAWWAFNITDLNSSRLSERN